MLPGQGTLGLVGGLMCRVSIRSFALITGSFRTTSMNTIVTYKHSVRNVHGAKPMLDLFGSVGAAAPFPPPPKKEEERRRLALTFHALIILRWHILVHPEAPRWVRKDIQHAARARGKCTEVSPKPTQSKGEVIRRVENVYNRTAKGRPQP